VASGRTEIIDVSTTPVLDLNGSLNNQGTIYLVSTNPSVRNVSIVAQNIDDGAGGLITTVLPSRGLAGYRNAINDLSLTLVARDDIVNNGTITSANNLTTLAGGTMINVPAAGAQAGLARVQAVSELDLLAGAVVNHGIVSSTAGNIDVAVPSNYASGARSFVNAALPAVLPQIISINNTSGKIQALDGTINIGGTELGKSALLSLTGGNLDAQTINLQAGAGAIEADVGDVTGTVNVAGGSAHFASDAGVLDLGRLKMAGDPTIFNAGDIAITAGFTVTEGLAILASGNITATTAVTIGAAGQNVYMVAGAKPPSGTPPGTVLTIPPLGSGQSITVSAGSDS
jgi:hypothetical protein